MMFTLPKDMVSSRHFTIDPAAADLLGAPGLTEVTCLCTAQTIEDAISNPGSVGRLYPCLEAKIVDEDFQPAKNGEPGEFCIRGATVMK